MSHSGDIALTQTLDKNTLLRGVYSYTGQFGYLAKPYRHLILFDQSGIDAASADGVTLDLDTLHDYRLPQRPIERLPSSRHRHALGLRAMRYLPSLEASLRLDYRFYFDSWGVMAHTVEPAYYQKLSENFNLEVYARGYTQSRADFYDRIYVTEPGSIVGFGSLDKKLSRYHTAAMGARLELQFGRHAYYGEVRGVYDWFPDHLLISRRATLVTMFGARWKF